MKRLIKKILILAAIGLLPILVNAKSYLTPLLNVSADSLNDVFVVDKAQQQLYIVKSNGPANQEIVRHYRITTGQAKGEKEREGDLRTPEGVYFIVNSIPGNKLPKKYGPVAYVLNYPNTVDRIFRRTGSNIWLHGRDVAIQDYQTEGCISMDNDSLIRLKDLIQVSGTPIIILDSLQILDDQGYNQSLAQWKNQIETWRNAWESGDTATYFHSYSPRFQDGVGQNYTQFTRHKAYLEKVYSWKKVSVSDIVVYTSDSQTIVSFDQRYYCPTFYGEGRKNLYYVLENGQWKIIAEEYQRSNPNLRREDFLRPFVQNWQADWEAGDIEQYIANYDSSFDDGERNFAEYKEYKSDIFTRTPKIKVDISDLRYSNIGPMEWQITFTQDYRAENYHDFGQKTLQVRGYPDNLKIYNESWTPIKSRAEN